MKDQQKLEQTGVKNVQENSYMDFEQAISKIDRACGINAPVYIRKVGKDKHSQQEERLMRLTSGLREIKLNTQSHSQKALTDRKAKENEKKESQFQPYKPDDENYKRSLLMPRSLSSKQKSQPPKDKFLQLLGTINLTTDEILKCRISPRTRETVKADFSKKQQEILQKNKQDVFIWQSRKNRIKKYYNIGVEIKPKTERKSNISTGSITKQLKMSQLSSGKKQKS